MKKIETTSGIYCIENKINGKKYIGQAVNLNRRLKRHLRELRYKISPNICLQKAWDKYGETNFIFSIIEECSIEELDNKEIFYIKELHSHVTDWGYNISWGGLAFMRGVEITEEHRRKLSAALSGENNPMYGHKYTPEELQKISDGLKGRVMSEESKQKSRITNAGMKRKGSKSSYKGVTTNPWGFVVRIPDPNEKKRLYLGSFRDEIEAAKAFDEKSWQLYHDLNKLNFPENYLSLGD